jgi:hypothetical protein
MGEGDLNSMTIAALANRQLVLFRVRAQFTLRAHNWPIRIEPNSLNQFCDHLNFQPHGRPIRDCNEVRRQLKVLMSMWARPPAILFFR